MQLRDWEQGVENLKIQFIVADNIKIVTHIKKIRFAV
jgi:hypothetical protein